MTTATAAVSPTDDINTPQSRWKFWNWWKSPARQTSQTPAKPSLRGTIDASTDANGVKSTDKIDVLVRGDRTHALSGSEVKRKSEPSQN